MENIVIRRMKPSDVEKVASLEKRNFSQPWSSQGFLEALLKEGTLFFVAVLFEEPIAYSGMYYAADEGEITNIAVEEKFRKNGVGRKLLQELLMESEKEGIHQIFLEVRVSNEAAISLYQSMGFKIVGVRKEFYQEPKEDAYIMKKS